MECDCWGGGGGRVAVVEGVGGGGGGQQLSSSAGGDTLGSLRTATTTGDRALGQRRQQGPVLEELTPQNVGCNASKYLRGAGQNGVSGVGG